VTRLFLIGLVLLSFCCASSRSAESQTDATKVRDTDVVRTVQTGPETVTTTIDTYLPEFVPPKGRGRAFALYQFIAFSIVPTSLGRMLVAAFRSPVMPEFMSSMPLVAYDGTMQRRLRSKDVAGQAHIKTGTLNEVRAIAGYVLAASGKRYAVTFLINSLSSIAAQGAQDALLQWVYAEG